MGTSSSGSKHLNQLIQYLFTIISINTALLLMVEGATSTGYCPNRLQVTVTSRLVTCLGRDFHFLLTYTSSTNKLNIFAESTSPLVYQIWNGMVTLLIALVQVNDVVFMPYLSS